MLYSVNLQYKVYNNVKKNEKIKHDALISVHYHDHEHHAIVIFSLKDQPSSKENSLGEGHL